MSGSRIDVVLVKLCAVIVVVLSLQNLAGYVGYFVASDGTYPLAILAFFFNFAIPLALAALLWFFPATAIGLKESSKSAVSTSTESAVRPILVGVTLVGLYAVVFGVVDLFYYEAVRAAETAYMGEDRFGTFRASPDTIAGRYTNIVQIVLGVLILVGRRGIGQALVRSPTGWHRRLLTMRCTCRRAASVTALAYPGRYLLSQWPRQILGAS